MDENGAYFRAIVLDLKEKLKFLSPKEVCNQLTLLCESINNNEDVELFSFDAFEDSETAVEVLQLFMEIFDKYGSGENQAVIDQAISLFFAAQDVSESFKHEASKKQGEKVFNSLRKLLESSDTIDGCLAIFQVIDRLCDGNDIAQSNVVASGCFELIGALIVQNFAVFAEPENSKFVRDCLRSILLNNRPNQMKCETLLNHLVKMVLVESSPFASAKFALELLPLIIYRNDVTVEFLEQGEIIEGLYRRIAIMLKTCQNKKMNEEDRSLLIDFFHLILSIIAERSGKNLQRFYNANYADLLLALCKSATVRKFKSVCYAYLNLIANVNEYPVARSFLPTALKQKILTLINERMNWIDADESFHNVALRVMAMWSRKPGDGEIEDVDPMESVSVFCDRRRQEKNEAAAAAAAKASMGIKKLQHRDATENDENVSPMFETTSAVVDDRKGCRGSIDSVASALDRYSALQAPVPKKVINWLIGVSPTRAVARRLREADEEEMTGIFEDDDEEEYLAQLPVGSPLLKEVEDSEPSQIDQLIMIPESQHEEEAKEMEMEIIPQPEKVDSETQTNRIFADPDSIYGMFEDWAKVDIHRIPLLYAFAEELEREGEFDAQNKAAVYRSSCFSVEDL